MKIFPAGLLSLMIAVIAQAQAISPVFFGQNHWLAEGDENRTGYLHLLWPKVKDSGVQLVRIGGHEYEAHPPSRARWTAMVESVQAIGAEPLLQIPRQFTAAEAADLVKHFNRPGRQPIRYWSIGNEPLLGDKVTVDEVYAYLMKIAPAMRAADPAIKIYVWDEAWMRTEAYEALCGGRLDITGKDAAGRWLIDGFSYHSYPNGETYSRSDVTGTGVEKIRDQTKQLVAIIDAANRKHSRAGDAALGWALTEVNVTYRNPDRNVEGIGNPSFLGGQFMAEVFGIGLEYGALTVAPWSINETDNVHTDFGYLGLPPDFAPRASYYHQQLLARTFHGSFMATRSNHPLLKSIGSKSSAGFALMLLNQEVDRELAVDLDFASRADANVGAGIVVRADAGVTIKPVSITIAPQTTQVLEFNGAGKLTRKWTYGVAQNLRQLPPVVEVIE